MAASRTEVRIVEVGARDGLQNEARTLSVEARVRFIAHLAASGLKHIEAGAFVSPKWVPQMAGTVDVIAALKRDARRFGKDVRFSALVPNVHGMKLALESGIREVAIFGACSESFSKRNINCSIDESLARFRDVMALAKPAGVRVRGYLSVAFGCPYEGPVQERRVVDLASRLLKLGVYEVSIGDTIGVATPKQVRSLVKRLKARLPLRRVAMHFHDTRGTALANVLAALDLGVRVFDSSFGGLGGCPYAAGASGNLATEDLVYMLHGMGFKTGVNLERLLEHAPAIQREVGHPLSSRLAGAGLPKRMLS